MKKIILVLFLLGLCLSASTQNYNHAYHLGTNDGLSSHDIYTAYRDRMNFVWIASSAGIDRYDGARVKHYTNNADNSIWINGVSEIKEDMLGNLFLKRYTDYMVYVRAKDNFMYVVDYLRTVGFNIRKDSPHRVEIDHEDCLWMAYTDGLYRYDMRHRKINYYPVVGIDDVKSARDGVYILRKDGVIVSLRHHGTISSVDKSFVGICAAYGMKYQSMMIDGQNRPWVYSAVVGAGIFYHDSARHWMHFGSTADADYRIKGNYISAVSTDTYGNVWIATEHQGIEVFFKKQKRLFTLPKGPNALYSSNIKFLYSDNEHTIWVGYQKKGLSYYSLAPLNFETYLYGKTNASEYESDVSSLLLDRNDNLWVGTDGFGIYRYGPDMNLKAHYDLNRSINVVACIYEDKVGRIWLGTYDDGVYYFSHDRWTHFLKGEKGLADKDVWSITEDDAGNLWIGGLGMGLQRYDEKRGRFEKSIKNMWIGKICRAWNHRIYCGAYGFTVFNTEKRTIGRTYVGNVKGTQAFSDARVRDMCCDSRRLIWLCGQRGISVYDEMRDTVYYITSNVGLCSDGVQAVTEDNSHNMWVTTGNGLSQIKVRCHAGIYSFVIKNYSVRDGLQFSSFNQRSIFADRRGNVYMGGSEGFCIHRPGHVSTKPRRPVLLFTDLHIGNDFIQVDSTYNDNIPLRNNINNAKEVRLSYSDRTITFYFSSPASNASGQCQYAYRLESLSTSEWIYTTEGKVSFDRLNPGRYVLKVKARNSDYLWSEVRELHIVVMPPLWQSWWAYLIYIILAALTAYYVYYFIRRRQEEKIRVQKIKIDLDKQRHINNMKFEFFTNVSHDFRTPLSLIITPVEKLLEDNKDKPIVKTLSTIHRNALQLKDMVNQLLDFAKLDESGEKVILSNADYIEFVRSICDEFALYQKGKMIDLHFSTSTEHQVFDFDKDKVRKILMNLLSNAFKFSPKNSVVIVEIEISGDEMLTSVKDNGIGIPDSEKGRVFDRFYQVGKKHLEFGSGIGLHIVSQYVNLLHGKITLTDNQPCGTCFCFSLPIILNQQEKTADDDAETTIATNAVDHNKRPRILLVEDNEDFLSFLDECLNGDYSISKAANGAEALSVLQQQDINLVISDIMMPVMDGLELCRKIKTDIALSHIPVVLLTARSTEEHRIEGLRDGADDYITKPFNLNILKLRIEKILEWGKQNHEKFTNKMDVKPNEITISSLDEMLIKKAIQAVEDNMDNSEFTVEDLGRAVGLSRGHLYRKIMSITGSGPLEFIRILRLKRAKQYLEKSQMSVSEIAYLVGYNTPKNFSKCFKEEFHLTPSEYKEKSMHDDGMQ